MSRAQLKSHMIMVTSWGTGQTLSNTRVLHYTHRVHLRTHKVLETNAKL
jgi:hypothetical protein